VWNGFFLPMAGTNDEFFKMSLKISVSKKLNISGKPKQISASEATSWT
jgi:hypothetical protein